MESLSTTAWRSTSATTELTVSRSSTTKEIISVRLAVREVGRHLSFLVFNSLSLFLIPVSNFPIGVGLTASGEICIADNHNNFNLTVFSQAGQLLGALESKVGEVSRDLNLVNNKISQVKHAQCFDVALMKDGSIVLASKDYRLYIYRYVKIPNLSP